MEVQWFLNKMLIYVPRCTSFYLLNMGTCHSFLLTGKIGLHKKREKKLTEVMMNIKALPVTTSCMVRFLYRPYFALLRTMV